MQSHTLPDLLAPYPEAAALIDRGRTVTRGALELESRRVAQGLLDLGVSEGDRVALWLPNVPAWLACLFACARIGAVEIEAVLDAHPAIAASQVVGIDGPRGTCPVSFVIVRGTRAFDEQALIAHCAARIAAYKLPRSVFVLDAFPVTHSANGTKIHKARLREMARELLSAKRALGVTVRSTPSIEARSRS